MTTGQDEHRFPATEAEPSHRLGFILSLSTGLLTLVTFVIAILTPPISGPFCLSDCVRYPFTDTLARFPRDFYWMYPATLLMLLFLAFLVVVQHATPGPRKVWGQLAWSFGLLAAGILVTDYFLQLSVIQPSLIAGETDGFAMLSQYNPHGVFIALEEIGYLLTCLALGCLAPIFWDRSRLGRAAAGTALATFALSVLSLVGISLAYGVMREYRFEVAVISITWLGMIAVPVMVAFLFRRGTSAR